MLSRRHYTEPEEVKSKNLEPETGTETDKLEPKKKAQKKKADRKK